MSKYKRYEEYIDICGSLGITACDYHDFDNLAYYDALRLQHESKIDNEVLSEVKE
jgi:hypothetical protein